ncbi:MAG: M48 family metallopeptidase [Trueperaceae bacterium]|nr:MAG: M48 family metallopeptidase [Trueperaceae bacterium]
MKAESVRIPEAITDVVTGRKISLLDWKATNQRASILLVVFLVGLLASIGYLVAQVFEPGAALFFVGFASLLALSQSAVAFWAGDRVVLVASGARPANRDEHRYLVNITEAVSIGAGVPRPKLYVIDSEAPNAFATGRDPNHGVVVVTTGLIALLDRQELEGVIAHELAHVKNYDILLMSLLAATVGAIVLLRDIVFRSMRFGGRRYRSAGGGSRGGKSQMVVFVLLALLMILAPVLAVALRMAVSRRREYLADATGAYITRNPEGLARALEKLLEYRGAPLAVSEGLRHMLFVNPVRALNAANIFATHPPLEDRIDRLRRM